MEERAVGIQELVVPHGGVEHACTRDVAEQHTEGDGQQEQGFVLFYNGKIEEKASDDNHHGISPTHTTEELQETHFADELTQRFSSIELLGKGRHSDKHHQNE